MNRARDAAESYILCRGSNDRSAVASTAYRSEAGWSTSGRGSEQTHTESIRLLQGSHRRIVELEQAWPKKRLTAGGMCARSRLGPRL